MAEPCPVEPLLSAHLDGELAPAETADLREHLGACGACAAELEQLRVVRSLVRSLPVRRLPEELVVPLGAGREDGAPRLARAGAALAIAAGLLTGVAFSLGGQAPPDVPVVRVPMDVYVADHFVHTANRALSVPVVLETGR